VELDTYTDRGPGGYRWNWTHTQTEDRGKRTLAESADTGMVREGNAGPRAKWRGHDSVDSSMRRRLAQDHCRP